MEIRPSGLMSATTNSPTWGSLLVAHANGTGSTGEVAPLIWTKPADQTINTINRKRKHVSSTCH